MLVETVPTYRTHARSTALRHTHTHMQYYVEAHTHTHAVLR